MDSRLTMILPVERPCLADTILLNGRCKDVFDGWLPLLLDYVEQSKEIRLRADERTSAGLSHTQANPMGEEQRQCVVLRGSSTATAVAFRRHHQPSMFIQNRFYVHEDRSVGTSICPKGGEPTERVRVCGVSTSNENHKPSSANKGEPWALQ